MFSQAPQDDASREELYTAGLLIRKQLEKAGLGAVADLFNQPAPVMADKPSVTMPRRRARPFTEMEPVVSEDDADAASTLMSLTRQFKGDAAAQAELKSELYKLYLQDKLR